MEPPFHRNTCCVFDFSFDEWETVDTLFNNLPCLSDHERQTIFYIAGYIQEKENLENATFSSHQNLCDSEFMSLVSRGKLTLPSEELFNFSLLCYAFFKKFETRCKRHLVRIFVVVFESYFFEFQSRHNVVSRLANTFMKGVVRKYNDSLLTASNERKKKKLSHV